MIITNASVNDINKAIEEINIKYEGWPKSLY